MKNPRKALLWVTVLLVIPGLIWAAAWLSSGKLGLLNIGPWQRPTAFMVTLFLMTVFCLLTGKAVTGLWRGLLIDDRNRISLSRLQTATWTVVVLSAILVAAFSNLAHQDTELKKSAKQGKQPPTNAAMGLPEDGPIDFAIPGELWAVLGISVTSLIGSPLLLDGKKNRSPEATEVAKVNRALADQRDDSVTNQGQVLIRDSPEKARWEDLFQTEEVGNGAHLDLAKVQNFYFTLILVFAYSNALFTMFGGETPIQKLPELSEGMVTLLGISHAAYLANKARTHSQTGAAEDPKDGVVNPTQAGAALRASASLPPLAPAPVGPPVPPTPAPAPAPAPAAPATGPTQQGQPKS